MTPPREHTPLPWKIVPPFHEDYHVAIVGPAVYFPPLIVNIGDGGNGKETQLANAEFIVEACNNYDRLKRDREELVKAAKKARLYLDGWQLSRIEAAGLKDILDNAISQAQDGKEERP